MSDDVNRNIVKNSVLYLQEFKMQLSEKAVIFEAVGGAAVIYANSNPFDGLYFSPDGVKYFQLLPFHASDVSDVHVLDVEDPYCGTGASLTRENDVLFFNGIQFLRREKFFPEIDVTPIPSVRRPEHLFELTKGYYLYVSTDKYFSSLESLRFFHGYTPRLNELKILGTKVLRDGRSMHLVTDGGVLSVPSLYAPWRTPLWKTPTRKRFPIEKLDPMDFLFDEGEGEVIITPCLGGNLSAAD